MITWVSGAVVLAVLLLASMTFLASNDFSHIADNLYDNGFVGVQ